VLGALTATLGLAAAVFAIVRAPEIGWAAPATWGTLLVAVALLVAFVALQAKRRSPLMPLTIFRAPNLGAANLAQLLLGAARIPMWFFVNYQPLKRCGLSLVPVAGCGVSATLGSNGSPLGQLTTARI